MPSPVGIPARFADCLQLMFDPQILAMRADLTRAITCMIGREGSLRTDAEIGVPASHHPLTHHGGNAESIERVTRINAYHAEQFAAFLGKLDAADDGDGTLLDRSMVVYGSGTSDGNKHTHEDLPIMLAGRGGALRLGRHVVYPRGTPLTNLFVALLGRIGARSATAQRSRGSSATSSCAAAIGRAAEI